MADQEFDVETGEEIIRGTPENQPEEGLETNLNNPGDDDEDGEDDQPLVNSTEDEGDTDEEREAIRERRRQERKHRKQVQREREESLRRELAARDTVINELRGKVEVIERRNAGSEVAQVENAIKQAESAQAFFKNQIHVATEAQNGAAVAEATERLFQVQRKVEELKGIRQALTQRQVAPPPLDPRMASYAESWMKKHPWYDPTGKDMDSEITLRIDQRMAQEGWDPTTPEYWGELESRVKKYLPHRANSGKIPSNKPRSVVTGSGRESAGSSGSSTYTLSAERVQALKEAGMWDDPKQRSEMIKRYRELDKQNKA